MTLVVRAIRRSRWTGAFDAAWLAKGDFPADALGDLNTSANAMSVYFLDQHGDLDRLAPALAATKDSFAEFDYAEIDLPFFNQTGIKIKEVLGDTPDTFVNNWHRDLIELSIRNLVDLVGVIHNHATIGRTSEKDVKRLLIESATSGYIERPSIKKLKMQTAIDELLVSAKRGWYSP